MRCIEKKSRQGWQNVRVAMPRGRIKGDQSAQLLQPVPCLRLKGFRRRSAILRYWRPRCIAYSRLAGVRCPSDAASPDRLALNHALTSPFLAATPPSSSTTLTSTFSPIAFRLVSLNPSKAVFAPPLSKLSLANLTPSFQSFARPDTCKSAAELRRT